MRKNERSIMVVVRLEILCITITIVLTLHSNNYYSNFDALRFYFAAMVYLNIFVIEKSVL